MDIRVKYHDEACRIGKIEQGDWVDLRSQEDVTLRAGRMSVIPLGVSMQLPRGYEAWVAPRSSLFKRHGIIMANSIGIIDNSYCGDDDVWGFPAYATRDTTVEKGERIAQFRVMPTMSLAYDWDFVEAERLDNESRGGFGSTGAK